MPSTSGHFTFLFTDIERSSQLWETHPQAMARALAQHDHLMRDVVAEHGGKVFKTIGDAFCVAFDTATEAARAALETQRALAAATWEETGPLRVRMALHSGEAEQRDDDYFGPTLNRVARILAAGHGGQTLLSRITMELVRNDLPAGASLRDLGERRLKDLRHPERIFQLVAEGLVTEFPPLRSLEVLPNNLPAQVTSFVGREREMAEVKRLLGTARLLTLSGPGGTGKTRLSLQVAAEVLDLFPHGVWLVELATVSDPELVPASIAGVVEVREEPGRAVLDTLADALKARRLLLVIDNCEHLVAACAQVASALLRRCPEVKILASSREPLSIDGETIWMVPSLAVPEFGRDEPDLDLAEIAGLEAVQLFIERAAAVRPGFALTAENAALVAKICWRLDGIPLAIELAAARVKLLPLAQILTRLDDRFHLLSGGSRTALPRQQTLGALIDWSYDLLSDAERTLLRRLAVFVAGRTLEMIEDVCVGEGLERAEIFDLLSALVDKSLVMSETGLDGDARYTMLESIWDYAEEKLAQHGETERYRDRHLDHFIRFAEKAEPELYAAQQAAWLSRISVENFNLNFALRWSLEQGSRIERGLRLAGALSRYWEVRNYLTEARETVAELLARADAAMPPGILAKAEETAGRLAWCQDDDGEALRHYAEAQRLYEIAGNESAWGLVEAFRGFAERNLGHAAEARAHFERAQAAGEKLKIVRLTATAMSGLGSLEADEGNLAGARALKERALEMFQDAGDLWVRGILGWSLGKVCVAQQDYAVARMLLAEALSTIRELGNKWTVPYVLEGLADIGAAQGQVARAVRLYGAASAQREAHGLGFSPAERAEYDVVIARLREQVGDEGFEAEWAAGRALSLQSAVTYVLSGRSDLPERPRRGSRATVG